MQACLLQDRKPAGGQRSHAQGCLLVLLRNHSEASLQRRSQMNREGTFCLMKNHHHCCCLTSSALWWVCLPLDLQKPPERRRLPPPGKMLLSGSPLWTDLAVAPWSSGTLESVWKRPSTPALLGSSLHLWVLWKRCVQAPRGHFCLRCC